MRAVNLLPPEATAAATAAKRPSAKLVLAAATPVVAAGLVYVGWSTEHHRVERARTELTAVQRRLAAVKPPADDGAAAAALAADKTQREAALTSVLDKRVAWDVVLDQVARVMPDDAWLMDISFQSPTPAGAPATDPSASSASPSTASAPSGVSISGQARSQAAVAQFVARLALVPALANVTLSSTTRQAGLVPVVQFEIGASVVPGVTS
jgi:Tfp pilus assembly protein PilN